jgi:methionine sulfoxide reductase heme-binding subunit
MWATKWVAKPLVFGACLLPGLYLAAGAFGILGLSLGADPVKYMLHACGLWALRFLFITLCMTPLRDATHSVFWLRFRRMFGLFAFFYVVLHFTVYLVLDQAGKLSALGEDILKRPYITIGMLGFVLLMPLALTSTAKMQRRLGRRWIKLHRLIYVVAVLGVWHFWWQVKKDIREPLVYACVLAVLLGYRLYKQRKVLSRFSAAHLGKADSA